VQVGGAGASRALYGLRQAAEREARRRLLADLSDPNLLLEAQCNSGMRPLHLAAQVCPTPSPLQSYCDAGTLTDGSHPSRGLFRLSRPGLPTSSTGCWNEAWRLSRPTAPAATRRCTRRLGTSTTASTGPSWRRYVLLTRACAKRVLPLTTPHAVQGADETKKNKVSETARQLFYDSNA